MEALASDAGSTPLAAVTHDEWRFWTEHRTLSKLISRMRKLPTLPALYVELQNELSNDEASVERVGELIGKDPAITAKVLRLVNSAVFGLSVKVCDASEAVVYLGAARTSALILAAALTKDFEETVCPGFSHEDFWQHSVTVANFAGLIARSETPDLTVTEAAFTAGLLHDIGKLLLAANLPDLHMKILEEAARSGLPIEEVERSILGGTHGELGACLIGKWGLPGALLEAIAWHNCPCKSTEPKFSPLTAVHVANSFAHEMSSAENSPAPRACDGAYLERLGLGERCSFWREVCELGTNS